MASRRKNVGKRKGTGRSTRGKKPSRPPGAPIKSARTISRSAGTHDSAQRSGLKSPARRQKSAAGKLESREELRQTESQLEKEGPALQSDVGAPIIQSIEQLDPDHEAVRAREILDKLQSTAADRAEDRTTVRRWRFIAEYMISGNGTQAAILAGFAPARADVTASELLKDPVVAAEIARRKAELHAKLQITQERVLTEKAAIAFSDIGEILGEDDDGAPVIRKLSEWSPTARKAVKSLKVRRIVPKKGEDERPVQILEFEFWSKPTAVDKLEARLDSEAAANRGVDLANLSDKERLRLIAEILSRGRAARDAVKGEKKTA